MTTSGNSRALAIASLTAPLVFISAGSRTFVLTSGSALASYVAATCCAIAAVLMIWRLLVAVAENKILLLESRRYREGARRFGILFGIASAAFTTVASFHWAEMRWASPVPYILITPGLMTFGFIAALILVRIVFWCFESLKDNT